MKSEKFIARSSKKEYEKLLMEFYPSLYEAYQLTKLFFEMSELTYFKNDSMLNTYPQFHLSITDYGKIEVMVDFSVGCSFFLNYKGHSDIPTITVWADVEKGFEYPHYFDNNTICTWMPQIVYKNYLYEKKIRE